MRRWIVVVAACGSSTPPPKPAVVEQAPPPKHEQVAKRDEIVSAHRKLEAEQQDALAATCTEPAGHEPHERCMPSCYPTEAADPRAGKKLGGAVEVLHLVCDGAVPLVGDELDVKALALRPVRGRFPQPHKKGSWQATLEADLAEHHTFATAKGDVLVVVGAYRDLTHPLTKERLHCATVAHVTHAMHRALDACGGDGLACEATGDAAARGINVVHYRLAEARRLQASDPAGCQQAALEAIAVARGLPRWRQYAKLNAHAWTAHAAYRTRFDGTLDEDALFAAATQLGSDAEAIYAACGGAAGAPTSATQEQSFHTCW